MGLWNLKWNYWFFNCWFNGENIWALFLKPEFEKQDIERKLHDTILDGYFEHEKTIAWLGTSANTIAEMFYK